MNDGACYPELSDFRCQCKDGFSGKQCEVNDDECATSPCKNGAECKDGLNNFKCVCQPGFKGRKYAGVGFFLQKRKLETEISF